MVSSAPGNPLPVILCEAALATNPFVGVIILGGGTGTTVTDTGMVLVLV